MIDIDAVRRRWPVLPPGCCTHTYHAAVCDIYELLDEIRHIDRRTDELRRALEDALNAQDSHT